MDRAKSICGTAILMLLGCGVTLPQTEASVYLAPLRTESASTRRLVTEVRTFVNSGTTDKAAIRVLGDRLIRGIASNRAMISRYQTSSTRFGLQEEYDLVVQIMADTDFLVKAYARLTGVVPRPPTAQELEAARTRTRTFLKRILRPVIAQKLGSEGLADALTAPSFDEAVGAVEARLSQRVLEDLDSDLRLFVETGIGGGSLEGYAREAGRRFVAKYVAGLIAKITTNSLVIDFIAGSIVRWAGAKLKRALRPRGNLDARTTRSSQVLEDAAMALNQLDGRDAMAVVRLALENARSALDSTKYLKGDIDRAGRTDLQEKMKEAIERLNRTIRLTEHRFLVETKMASLDLNAHVQTLDSRMAQIRQMQTTMQPGERDPIVAPDAPADRDEVAGRYDSNCIRGCDTSYMGDPSRSPWTYTLTLTGTKSEVEFEYRAVDQGRVRKVVRGRCKWIGGEAGGSRTLKGTGIEEGGSREREAIIMLERSGGVWRAARYYGPVGVELHLTKERRGAPR